MHIVLTHELRRTGNQGGQIVGATRQTYIAWLVVAVQDTEGALRIDISVQIGAGDEVTAAHVFARIKDLGIDFSDGDADGRRWLRVRGQVGPDELMKIISEIERSEQIR